MFLQGKPKEMTGKYSKTYKMEFYDSANKGIRSLCI
jgi:hypothetical protein